VMTALIHKVPLLVIPHGRDQGDNADRVTSRGVGLSLPPSALVEQLRAAVHRLLEDPSFCLAAHRLGELVATEARDSRLIEEIEELAGSTRCDADLDRRASLIGLLGTAVSFVAGTRSRSLQAASPDSSDKVNLSWPELPRSPPCATA
jgi:hypothetical protein